MLRRAPAGVAEERLVTFIYQPIRDAVGDISGIFVEGSDVTDAVRARARQKEVERLARATMDSLGEHIAVIDEAGTIIVVNDAWRKFAEGNGVAASAVSEGSNYLVACDKAAAAGDTLAGEVAALIREVAAGSRSTAEIEYPCHSPVEQRWFHLKIARFKDDGPVRVVVAHEDITARHKSDQRIEYLATHDALTGLPNRRLFQDRAAQAFEHSKRAGLGTAILFLDLDNFKLVNDAYGHAIGDEVLVSTAQLLASMIRSGETIARFGGDVLELVI
jgi:PAS domain-containing protein